MDINSLRSLATVLAFIAFVSVCLWAYSCGRRADFDEAAQLPFADDPRDPPAISSQYRNNTNNKGAETP